MNLNSINFAKKIGPIVLFYLGWWGIVLLVMNQYSLWSQLALMVIALLSNLAFAESWKRDFLWILVGGSVGFLMDSALQSLGVLSFSGASPYFAPPWIYFLWVLFCSSFSSFTFLRRHKVLLVLTGAVGGPFAYWLGEPMKLIEYQEPKWLNILQHSLIWAWLYPMLFILRDRCLRLRRS